MNKPKIWLAKYKHSSMLNFSIYEKLKYQKVEHKILRYISLKFWTNKFKKNFWWIHWFDFFITSKQCFSHFKKNRDGVIVPSLSYPSLFSLSFLSNFSLSPLSHSSLSLNSLTSHIYDEKSKKPSHQQFWLGGLTSRNWSAPLSTFLRCYCLK